MAAKASGARRSKIVAFILEETVVEQGAQIALYSSCYHPSVPSIREIIYKYYDAHKHRCTHVQEATGRPAETYRTLLGNEDISGEITINC